jgi:imidazole glycerol-phosphate synthase subunit HisH
VTDVIGLIRTPIGNLQSAFNAFYELGFEPVWVDAGFESYDDLTHLVVPGVGNFAAVMSYLNRSGLAADIKSFAASGRPLLGICVERLSLDPSVRLPHVGWNTVAPTQPHPVLEGIKPGRDFYFVHSFGMFVEDEANQAGRTHYGRDFSSIVAHANIVGCQFHPEKSQVNGLKILENFGFWDGRC